MEYLQKTLDTLTTRDRLSSYLRRVHIFKNGTYTSYIDGFNSSFDDLMLIDIIEKLFLLLQEYKHINNNILNIEGRESCEHFNRTLFFQILTEEKVLELLYKNYKIEFKLLEFNEIFGKIKPKLKFSPIIDFIPSNLLKYKEININCNDCIKKYSLYRHITIRP